MLIDISLKVFNLSVKTTVNIDISCITPFFLGLD